MFFNVTEDDILRATKKAREVKTFLHVRYNPIACALERHFGEGNIVITNEKVHISCPMLAEVYPLSEPAKMYLNIFRHTTRARPVDSILVFQEPEYR